MMDQQAVTAPRTPLLDRLADELTFTERIALSALAELMDADCA